MRTFLSAMSRKRAQLFAATSLLALLLSACSPAGDVAGEAKDLPASPGEAAEALDSPRDETENTLRAVACRGLERARRAEPPSRGTWATLVARETGIGAPNDDAREAGTELARRFGGVRGSRARALAVRAGCAVKP